MISIRESIPEDNERLTEIWLNASVKAHDFIPKDFWTDKVENMKRHLFAQFLHHSRL